MNLKELFIRQHFNKIYNIARFGYGDIKRCELTNNTMDNGNSWKMEVDKTELYDSIVILLDLLTDEKYLKVHPRKSGTSNDTNGDFFLIADWSEEFCRIATLSHFRSVWSLDTFRKLLFSADQYIHVMFDWMFKDDCGATTFKERINIWNKEVGSSFYEEIDMIRNKRNSVGHLAQRFCKERDLITNEVIYQFYDYIIFFYTLYHNVNTKGSSYPIKDKVEEYKAKLSTPLDVKIKIEKNGGFISDLTLKDKDGNVISPATSGNKELNYKLHRFRTYTISIDRNSNTCEFTTDVDFAKETTVILWRPTIKSDNAVAISKLIFGDDDAKDLPVNFQEMLHALDQGAEIDEETLSMVRSLIIFGLTLSPREEARINDTIKQVTEALKNANNNNPSTGNIEHIGNAIDNLKQSIAEDYSSDAVRKLCEMIDSRYSAMMDTIGDSAVSDAFLNASIEQAEYEKLCTMLDLYKNNLCDVAGLDELMQSLQAQEAEALGTTQIEAIRDIISKLNDELRNPGLFAIKSGAEYRFDIVVSNHIKAEAYLRMLRNIYTVGSAPETVLFLKLNPTLALSMLTDVAGLFDGTDTKGISLCRGYISEAEDIVRHIISGLPMPAYLTNFTREVNREAMAAFSQLTACLIANNNERFRTKRNQYQVSKNWFLRNKLLVETHTRIIELITSSPYIIESACLKPAFFDEARYFYKDSGTEEKISKDEYNYNKFFETHIKDRTITVTHSNSALSNMIDKLYDKVSGALGDPKSLPLYLRPVLDFNDATLSKVEKTKVIMAYLSKDDDISRICAIIDTLSRIIDGHRRLNIESMVKIPSYICKALDNGFGNPDWQLTSILVFDKLPDSAHIRSSYITRIMRHSWRNPIRFLKALAMCIKIEGDQTYLCYISPSALLDLLIHALNGAPSLKFHKDYNACLHAECDLINFWAAAINDDHPELREKVINDILKPMSEKCRDFISSNVKFVEPTDTPLYPMLKLNAYVSRLRKATFADAVGIYNDILNLNKYYLTTPGSRTLVETEQKAFDKIMSFSRQESADYLYDSLYQSIAMSLCIPDDVRVQRINSLYNIMPMPADYMYKLLCRIFNYNHGIIYLSGPDVNLRDMFKTIRGWINGADISEDNDDKSDFNPTYIIDAYTMVTDLLAYDI